MSAGSKKGLLLAEAEPVSDGGSTSLKRERKPFHGTTLQTPRLVKKEVKMQRFPCRLW